MTGLNNRDTLKVFLYNQEMVEGVANGTSIFCHPTRKCTGKEEWDKKE